MRGVVQQLCTTNGALARLPARSEVPLAAEVEKDAELAIAIVALRSSGIAAARDRLVR
jgi:hypothetical protein